MAEKVVQIAWISNVIFEPYIQAYIKSAFLPTENSVQLNCVMYEEINSDTETLKNADIVVVCLNFEELYPNLMLAAPGSDYTITQSCNDIKNNNLDLLFIIKSISKAKIIWFGFEDYFSKDHILFGTKNKLSGFIDRVNLSLCEDLNDDVFVDFKRLIALCGIYNSYNAKGKYRWNAPYSKELIKLMADEVYKQYLIHTGQTKKCIVLDCDNVIWGGILSEDGIERIHIGSSGLGREYQDFQRFLLNLYYHGVILTVCSKNDEDDVLRVFREHSGMLLRKEHIACFKVNWNDKPANIKAIADELNIGTESMVFVDDSMFEIEAVKSVLPEVTTIRYDRESIYNEFSCFNLKSEVNLPEVEQRIETYRTNRSRSELKMQCDSYDEYVKSLDSKVDIHEILPTEYSRVAELTQRTNKCTNGKRYTVPEIKERMTVPEVHFYSVSLSDRFSDLGIVGAMEVENDELKLFSLSCRALGRNVENEMINYVSDRYELENIVFKLTDKNEQLMKLMRKTIPNAGIVIM